jgi:hypothetical protein
MVPLHRHLEQVPTGTWTRALDRTAGQRGSAAGFDLVVWAWLEGTACEVEAQLTRQSARWRDLVD